MKHKGSCHCGNTRFEVTADINRLRVCDCSICRRRGALIFRVPAQDFTLLSPWENLSVYQWGSGTAKDYFCKTCGILPFRKPSAPTRQEQSKGMQVFKGWAINVRCLDSVDIDQLPKEQIFGSNLIIE